MRWTQETADVRLLDECWDQPGLAGLNLPGASANCGRDEWKAQGGIRVLVRMAGGQLSIFEVTIARGRQPALSRDLLKASDMAEGARRRHKRRCSGPGP